MEELRVGVQVGDEGVEAAIELHFLHHRFHLGAQTGEFALADGVDLRRVEFGRGGAAHALRIHLRAARVAGQRTVGRRAAQVFAAHEGTQLAQCRRDVLLDRAQSPLAQ